MSILLAHTEITISSGTCFFKSCKQHLIPHEKHKMESFNVRKLQERGYVRVRNIGSGSLPLSDILPAKIDIIDFVFLFKFL